LLIGRSQKQQQLELEFIVGADTPAAAQQAVANAHLSAERIAKLAGKNLAVTLQAFDLSISERAAGIAPHRISLRVPLAGDASSKRLASVFALTRKPQKLATAAKLVQGESAAETGAIVLHVTTQAFAAAVQALHRAGFPIIELDLDSIFIRPPEFAAVEWPSNPPDLAAGLAETAAYYVDCLKRHDYFRLEPLASRFQQIHRGQPTPRRDDAGTFALAIAPNGHIVPAMALQHDPTFRAGSVLTGEIDETALRLFDDVGANTTAACRRCWARNVCGGGTAAVHHALTGSIRTPDDAWCAMQRTSIETTVSAFNDLAAAGIPFDRVYAQLGRNEAPSLFQIARAAFRSELGLRPLAESDADMLRDWETWNRSAYFLLNERNVFLSNAYEREVDATHPRPGEFEMIVVTKRGAPAGLLKVRTARETGIAELFLYLRDASFYDSTAVAKSLRALLKEAAAGQHVRRILAPAAPWEPGLKLLLTRCGFTQSGTCREAVFTKGAYHDVAILTAQPDSL
jgi:radical SAM protein with 4Fe4S-binding SPASM domain